MNRMDWEDQGRCGACGHRLEIGDFPFCPHGRSHVASIGDDVPGGFTVENGFDAPTTFYSKKAHAHALAERGLEVRAKWAGPHDKIMSRWDAVSAHQLEAARELVSRPKTKRHETPIEKTSLGTTFRVGVDA